MCVVKPTQWPKAGQLRSRYINRIKKRTLWPPLKGGGGSTLYLTLQTNPRVKISYLWDAPAKAWCNVRNEWFLTAKSTPCSTENSRGKSVNNLTQDGRLNYATLCCRGQIIAGQTSSSLQASCSPDKAGRHDALCKVHWPWDSVMDWWHQRFNALSLSIYTQLAANTLGFYVFVLRFKHPRGAIGFVSHCRHCCKPATCPTRTANIYQISSMTWMS